MAPETAAGMAPADAGIDWAAEGNRESFFFNSFPFEVSL